MNRRDALKTAAAGVAAAVPGAQVEVKEASDPVLIVIRTDKKFTAEQREMARRSIIACCHGTVLENVAVVVCQPGVEIDVIDCPKAGTIQATVTNKSAKDCEIRWAKS